MGKKHASQYANFGWLLNILVSFGTAILAHKRTTNFIKSDNTQGNIYHITVFTPFCNSLQVVFEGFRRNKLLFFPCRVWFFHQKRIVISHLPCHFFSKKSRR